MKSKLLPLRTGVGIIVLNSLNDKGAGFNHDTNKVTFINNKNDLTEFKLKTKLEVSEDIFNEIIKLNDK